MCINLSFSKKTTLLKTFKKFERFFHFFSCFAPIKAFPFHPLQTPKQNLSRWMLMVVICLAFHLSFCCFFGLVPFIFCQFVSLFILCIYLSFKNNHNLD